MAFSTEASDRLWWLMVSDDVNAVRLVLTALRLDAWQRGHAHGSCAARWRDSAAGCWDLTTANAWGVLALERFSQKFETEPVTGTTRAGLAGASAAVDWAASPRGDALRSCRGRLERPSSTRCPPGDGQTVADRAEPGGDLPLRAPVRSGFTIRETVSAVDRHSAGALEPGRHRARAARDRGPGGHDLGGGEDPMPAGASDAGAAASAGTRAS